MGWRKEEERREGTEKDQDFKGGEGVRNESQPPPTYTHLVTAVQHHLFNLLPPFVLKPPLEKRQTMFQKRKRERKKKKEKKKDPPFAEIGVSTPATIQPGS